MWQLNNRRFALRGVTYDGVAMPGATVDCWQDAQGRSQWSARLVTRSTPAVAAGELAGQTIDGRAISGHVVMADHTTPPGSRRETLVVFYGSGSLHELGE
jgi:hypothetical protein